VLASGLMLGLLYVDWSQVCEGCAWLDPGLPIEAFVGCPAGIIKAAQPLFMSVTDQINARSTKNHRPCVPRMLCLSRACRECARVHAGVRACPSCMAVMRVHCALLACESFEVVRCAPSAP
jgi:hypothetical protein